MIKEFRDFVMRGNVLDLAVGVIIGAAFTAIINSLVGDIIMPIVGVLIGGLDFSSLSVTIGSAVIAYGKFLQAMVSFLLIALVLFMVIKSITAAQRSFFKDKEAEAHSAPPEDVELLREIRDILKSR